MDAQARYSKWLWVILLAGLALRLLHAAAQPTIMSFYHAGSDSGWYLAVGWGFFSGQEHGWIRNIPFTNASIPTPPLYIIFAGFFQQFLGEHETAIAIRLLQCLASIATAYLAFRIGALLGGPRAGIAGAALVSFHPTLIFEPANIATETLYIFFLACGLWLYLEYFVVAPSAQSESRLSDGAALALTAVAFALATLTRAVAVLFPIGLAAHMLLLHRRGRAGSWRRNITLLLTINLAILSTWTVYNLALWDRFVFVSDRLLPAIWRGLESEDGSPQQNDALLLAGEEAEVPEGCEIDCGYHHPPGLYLERIGEIIAGDGASLIALRARELAYSLLQPHGTTQLGDISVIDAARDWLGGSRALPDLLAIVRVEGFAIKLLIWLFHLGGMGLGLLGMFWSRKRWPIAAPLMGFTLYTVLAHTVVLALPRYLFAIEVIWLIFAGVALVTIYDRWRRKFGREAAAT